jgi:hypothetical protein
MTVFWTNGDVQLFENVPTNQRLTITIDRIFTAGF